MENLIHERFEDKKILLLGFGREGQSTFTLLRKIFPNKMLTIADQSERVRENPLLKDDPSLHFLTGTEYLSRLNDFDVIFRSPGIPIWKLIELDGKSADGGHSGSTEGVISRENVTSQTELFLERYSKQVIGITGTKGKSTTSSLIHHILKTAGNDTILAGNIGNPMFHFIDIIKPETKIVAELSSHQLEFIKMAPHIAVLLNLYQEHLDAYKSYDAYRLAKLQITKYQEPGDYFIYNADDKQILMLVDPFLKQRRCYPFSVQKELQQGGFVNNGYVSFARGKEVIPVWKIHQDRFLRGEHNLRNILAAVNVAMICGVEPGLIEEGIATFKGLEHRLEYLGEYHRIHFYNDSIATIPEATIEALKAIPDVDTLIAGGFDRGVDYQQLAEFISRSTVRNIILVGDAGKRIMENLSGLDHKRKKIFYINRFDELKSIALRETRPGYVCLLSPAAASYDEFNNFEERGKRFRELVGSQITKGRP
jgi:UDP-N-acetylmuramoyl-L-alanine---L-glutamate ligase